MFILQSIIYIYIYIVKPFIFHIMGVSGIIRCGGEGIEFVL